MKMKRPTVNFVTNTVSNCNVFFPFLTIKGAYLLSTHGTLQLQIYQYEAFFLTLNFKWHMLLIWLKVVKSLFCQITPYFWPREAD